jgi:hypothetical protein
MLKAVLRTRHNEVKSLQLVQFLDFVQDTYPWFPEEGTVNLEIWQKSRGKIRDAEGPDGMLIFTFGMWSQIQDCVDPAPIHKLRIKSFEAEPRGYKKSGDDSHLSFNQFQPSPPSAPRTPLADFPLPFFKSNPPSTDMDSESKSKSKDSDNEEDYQDALPQPFQKSFSTISCKKSPLQHTLALA